MTALNRVGVVTGANKGIGKHVARQLAQAGFTVYVGSRDKGRGQATVDELTAEGLDARLLVLDVTDPDTIASAVSEVGKAFDHLDVLVNNAGINTGFTEPSDTTIANPSASNPGRMKNRVEPKIWSRLR